MIRLNNMEEQPEFKPAEESQENTDSQYTRPEIPPKYKHKIKLSKTLSWILAVILVLVLAVGGLYYFKKHSHEPAKTNQNTQQPVVDTTKDVPDTKELKTYKSDNLNLQFKYPADWTVTEKDGIRIESPTFNYSTTIAQTSGKFRIYIRQGSRTVDSKYIGKGVAIQPSEKLTYSEPANGQRSGTILSFFGFTEPNNFAYFLITSDYNLKKGDSLAPNYAHESEAFLIAGGYSASANQDDLNFNTVPIDSAQTTKAYSKAVDILKSLQLY